MPTDADLSYPGGDLTFYGVTGSLYTEDGGVIFGHGRRALAAANALGRYEGGAGWYRPHGVASFRPTAKELWGTFVESCGCTPEEHAADDHECDCDYPGLPPCGDDYAWLCQTAVERRPGYLPIVEVKW